MQICNPPFPLPLQVLGAEAPCSPQPCSQTATPPSPHITHWHVLHHRPVGPSVHTTTEVVVSLRPSLPQAGHTRLPQGMQVRGTCTCGGKGRDHPHMHATAPRGPCHPGSGTYCMTCVRANEAARGWQFALRRPVWAGCLAAPGAGGVCLLCEDFTRPGCLECNAVRTAAGTTALLHYTLEPLWISFRGSCSRSAQDPGVLAGAPLLRHHCSRFPAREKPCSHMHKPPWHHSRPLVGMRTFLH